MTTYIALLRGINVGGHHKVNMAELREVVTQAGGEHVKTYIQSGNVVFSHNASAKKLVTLLESAISQATGFGVPVVLRTAAQMADVIAKNPFVAPDSNHLHVSFFEERPDPQAFVTIDAEQFDPEGFTVVGRELYLYLPNGMGRAKLPVALGRIKGPASTTRNWRTVTKLAELTTT